MRLQATVKEMLALGLRRSAAFGFFRARRTLTRILGRNRTAPVALTDEEWRTGLRRGDPETVVRDFLDGSADLGWFAATDSLIAMRHLRARFPDHTESVLSEAGQILQGSVVLFTTPVNVLDATGGIDWQRDWLGSYRWKASQHSNTIPIGREPGADPRVAWELGRCLHLLTLAQAYALSDQDRYARTAADHILSFVAGNPVGKGIQWASTMDVAIRATNWLAVWQFIRRSPTVAAAAPTILRSLVDHGRYIRAHLENEDGITSNHYLADLAGLACLGRLASLWPEAAGWTDYWAANLPDEIASQVLDDGFGFEASVSYHKLSLELLAYPLAIPGLRERLPETSVERLLRMVPATSVYRSISGLAPQFGDNDGGRLHLLHRRDPLDHSYLSMFHRVVGNPGERETPETIWLFGSAPEVEDSISIPILQVLPNAGIGVLRDRGVELILTCGPNGQAERGGHAHNDKASFVLFVGGREVMVDPGTFCYTRDLAVRQQFRSTAFHSTLELGGQEQNRFSYLSGFRLIPDATPLPIVTRTRGNRTTICTGHTGFERPPVRLRHWRRFGHRSGTSRWTVLDLLQPVGDGIANPVSIVYSLPLAPDVSVEQVETRGWRLRTGNGKAVTGEVRTRGIEGEWKVEDGWLSSSYGERRPTVFLRFRGRILQRIRRPALLLTIEACDH